MTDNNPLTTNGADRPRDEEEQKRQFEVGVEGFGGDYEHINVRAKSPDKAFSEAEKQARRKARHDLEEPVKRLPSLRGQRRSDPPPMTGPDATPRDGGEQYTTTYLPTAYVGVIVLFGWSILFTAVYRWFLIEGVPEMSTMAAVLPYQFEIFYGLVILLGLAICYGWYVSFKAAYCVVFNKDLSIMGINNV